MITLYRYELHPAIQHFLESVDSLRYRYYASEWAHDMDIKSIGKIVRAIRKAKRICSTMGFSVREHFQPVYKSGRDGVEEDYKLTSFAIALLCVNSEVTNPQIAKMQMDMVLSYLSVKKKGTK